MPDISDNTNWFETDASNQTTPPNGWPEGQLPSTLNDCARSMMGGIKRFWNRVNPTAALTPASGAYTLTTSNTAFPTVYIAGERFTFRAAGPSVGGDTFQVNTLGAKPIQKPVYTSGAPGYAAIAAGDIATGMHPQLVYEASLAGGAGAFVLQNPFLPISQDNAGGISVPDNATIAGNVYSTNFYLTNSGATGAGGVTYGYPNSNGPRIIMWGNTSAAAGAFDFLNGSSSTVNMTLDTSGNLSANNFYSLNTAAAGSITYGYPNNNGPRIMMWGNTSGGSGEMQFATGASGAVNLTLDTSGNLQANGWVAAIGYICRAGVNGATRTNRFNFDWPGDGTIHAWIDTTDEGVIAFQSWVQSQGYTTQSWVNGNFLPLAGGQMNGGITLPNNIALAGKDTGGTSQALIYMGSDNQTYVGTTGHNLRLQASGASAVYTSGNFVAGGLSYVGGTSVAWQYSSPYMQCNQAVQVNAIIPTGDNSGVCGQSGHAWSVVSYWSLFNASGRDKKTNITPLADGALDKVMALQPASYYWKEEGWLDNLTGRRTPRKLHAGFVADEVAAVFGKDFGGYHDWDEGEGIDPNELLAVLWAAVRELAAMVQK